MIPQINQPFIVSLGEDDHFNAVILSIDNNPANSDRQYKIQQTKRRRVEYGRSYSLPDSIIEVEKNWFNTELTGRKITII